MISKDKFSIFSSEIIYYESSEIFISIIKKILINKKNVLIGVCGGRAVGWIFDNIKIDSIDWSRVHFFMTDERMVNIKNYESNFHILNDNFLNRLKRNGQYFEDNIHPFIMNEKVKDLGLLSYKNDFEVNGGKYDLLLLSSGEDGHIAGLFPKHHSIYDESESFIVFKDSPKNPPHRMSMSRKMVLKSNNAVLLFIGESKKHALNNFINPDISWEECPAKLLNNIHNLYVITDQKIWDK